jgi:thymidylate kinase
MKKIVSGNYKALLTKMFMEFDDLEIGYCVCGNYDGLPESTSHDVDIWVSDLRIAFKILLSISLVLGLKVYLSNRTANGYNVFLYRNCGFFIEIYHLDLLQDCSWFSCVPLVSKSVIGANLKRYNGFWVANDEVETVMHFIYPLVTNGLVKKKYREKVFNFRNSLFFQNSINHLFGQKIGRYLIDKIDTREWTSVEETKNKLRIRLMTRVLMGVVRPSFNNFIAFFESNVSRLFKPSGLFIAFVGLDGAGKTTIINSLEGFFQEGFASGKVQNYYWRPFLLPEPGRLIRWFRRNERTEFSEASTDFFDYRVAKTKHSIFKSPLYFFKFFYYLLDFILGRLKYQGAWSRGGVVCFDRYYYDLLVFPERFGFKVPKGLIRFFSHFIPKPDICFYLYSPSKVLLERKGEVPEQEIIRQTAEYDRLSMEYSNIIKIDTSKSIRETHSEIITNCLETMRSRYVGK